MTARIRPDSIRRAQVPSEMSWSRGQGSRRSRVRGNDAVGTARSSSWLDRAMAARDALRGRGHPRSGPLSPAHCGRLPEEASREGWVLTADQTRAASGIRTRDLQITSQVLCQLSYGGAGAGYAESIGCHGGSRRRARSSAGVVTARRCRRSSGGRLAGPRRRSPATRSARGRARRHASPGGRAADDLEGARCTRSRGPRRPGRP